MEHNNLPGKVVNGCFPDEFASTLEALCENSILQSGSEKDFVDERMSVLLCCDALMPRFESMILYILHDETLEEEKKKTLGVNENFMAQCPHSSSISCSHPQKIIMFFSSASPSHSVSHTQTDKPWSWKSHASEMKLYSFTMDYPLKFFLNNICPCISQFLIIFIFTAILICSLSKNVCVIAILIPFHALNKYGKGSVHVAGGFLLSPIKKWLLRIMVWWMTEAYHH